jgi:nucleotide-binding universal stress UspA family protein
LASVVLGAIPTGVNGTPHETVRIMKILLAVDGSESSEAAAQAVVTRFRPESTEVRVLHAVEWLKEMPPSFAYALGPACADDIVKSREESYQRAGHLVARIGDMLSAAGFRTSVSTPDLDPRHAIIDAAAQWPADLIVMGSHGRRGIDRLLMGSVAEAVVRHAPCSVEIERALPSSVRASGKAA